MQTNQMADVIDLVNSEATRLGDFLSGLDEQEWTQDSACEGWSIGDVVGHLSSGAEGWANSITRALAGDAGPPPGQSFLAPGERGSDIISQGAISYRQQVGPKLLDNFSTGYDRLGRMLSELGAEDWEKPCYHRRGTIPIREYVEVRAQELTVHGWDIRSGLDDSAELWEESLALMVGRVPRWLNGAFRPGLGLPAPTLYRFDVSAPVPVHQDILVNGDAFQLAPAAERPADVTFRCNTGNYILFIYGRLELDRAVSAGKVAIQGPQERANNFTAWFQGF